MSKADKTAKFVEEVFEMYDINKFGFFFDLDDETMEEITTPLFPNNKIDEETLTRVSTALGLTNEEILARDMTAAKRYWDKYPFFELFQKYNSVWYWNARYQEAPSAEEILMKAIFTDDTIAPQERYDYQSVKKRLIQQLKDMDKLVPGTYHDGAHFIKLTISTEVFISFPQITQMLRSFVDMVERLEALFFKGIHQGLAREEILEYNFLVNTLHAVDIVMPSTLITYDKLSLYKSVYIAEGYSSIFSYIKIKSFISTEPWRCKEFFEDMDVVRKFVNIFPEAKVKMREFSMEVSQFSCTYVWSDAEHIRFSDEEEAEMRELALEYIPIEERALVHDHVYVPKTTEEMYGWEEFADRINAAASPANLGGLDVAAREWKLSPQEAILRMRRRVAAKRGGII